MWHLKIIAWFITLILWRKGWTCLSWYAYVQDVEIMGEKSSSTKTQETLDVQCKRLEQEKNILRSEVARLHKHVSC